MLQYYSDIIIMAFLSMKETVLESGHGHKDGFRVQSLEVCTFARLVNISYIGKKTPGMFSMATVWIRR